MRDSIRPSAAVAAAATAAAAAATAAAAAVAVAVAAAVAATAGATFVRYIFGRPARRRRATAAAAVRWLVVAVVVVLLLLLIRRWLLLPLLLLRRWLRWWRRPLLPLGRPLLLLLRCLCRRVALCQPRGPSPCWRRSSKCACARARVASERPAVKDAPAYLRASALLCRDVGRCRYAALPRVHTHMQRKSPAHQPCTQQPTSHRACHAETRAGRQRGVRQRDVSGACGGFARRGEKVELIRALDVLWTAASGQVVHSLCRQLVVARSSRGAPDGTTAAGGAERLYLISSDKTNTWHRGYMTAHYIRNDRRYTAARVPFTEMRPWSRTG